MKELSITQQTILQIAAGRADGAILPMPDHIKGGAAIKVIASLRTRWLIEEIDGKLILSEVGYRAIGREPPKVETKPRRTRENSKQNQVISMLHRPEGATAAQIAEVTGWQNHTIRGFLSASRKKLGLEITTFHTRQVGPNKQGSPGSYTTYFAK